MNNLFHAFAEYSVLIGIAVFLVISLLLAVLLGVLMRRAGVSLKPLVFFFGFLAIIAMPQIVIRLLDAFVHARQISSATEQRLYGPYRDRSDNCIAGVVEHRVRTECRSELDHRRQTQSGLHPQRRTRSENFLQRCR
jgi:hypothetical protein